MLKKFFISTLCIVIFLQTNIFAQTINLDQAALETKKTHKSPLVYLHRTGCPYCERLEEFTFDDDDVHDYIEKNFNFIQINVSYTEDIIIYKNKKMTPREFAITIGYNFFPSVLFLDAQANLEHASVGYIEEKDFLIILKYMKTDAYKTIDIDQYKKQIGFTEENSETTIDKRQKL
ncbi:thioredoxin family protein [Sulfurimonas sp.]|uniref:thioredoxin family protein n=1 Tax=Sulfurimonas sp. TaxID=2022749 RepID=UPI003D0AB1C1